ncbi:MAG: ABC transporter permease, partial [Solirubrobacteraceae bacterium]
MRRGFANVLPPLLLGLAFLGAWELYVDLQGVDQLLLPAPHAMFAEMWDNAGLLWSNFTITAKEVVFGLALALVGGFAMAVAIHMWTPMRRAVYPHTVGSQ